MTLMNSIHVVRPGDVTFWITDIEADSNDPATSFRISGRWKRIWEFGCVCNAEGFQVEWWISLGYHFYPTFRALKRLCTFHRQTSRQDSINLFEVDHLRLFVVTCIHVMSHKSERLQDLKTGSHKNENTLTASQPNHLPLFSWTQDSQK
jgi:hypothetical protein